MIGEQQEFIAELDQALASGAISQRADALRRITDLFMAASAAYSDQQIALFDEVMVRLSTDMETSIRVALAGRLAAIPTAPRNLMRLLAADPAIEVAGPVLKASSRLDDPTLVERAQTGSQAHLLAISQRASIAEAVTDVLVERGDRIVALSTVNNAGARFSSAGHRILVERSKDDEDLAVGVLSRDDMPHHQLLKLFSVASENVRRALEAADRHKTLFIRDMIAGVSNQMQDRLREQARDYIEAERTVAELHRAGKLDEDALRSFAAAGRFDEATVALSILCDLPIGACERAMVQPRAELVLLLARAIGLSWNAAKALLLLRAGADGMAPANIDQSLNAFSKLRPDTARKALQFLRLRERAAISNPGATGYQ